MRLFQRPTGGERAILLVLWSKTVTMCRRVDVAVASSSRSSCTSWGDVHMQRPLSREENGSDGTRTRDLRHDRPREPGTGENEQRREAPEWLG